MRMNHRRHDQGGRRGRRLFSYGWILTAMFTVAALCLLNGGMAVAAEEGGHQSAELAMGDWVGKPILSLTIDGQGPFQFIVDTGAGVSVIDETLRDALQLEVIGEVEVGSPMGEPVTRDILELRKIRIGSIELERADTIALDLAALFGEGPETPRGVLSTRAITGHTVTFDFPRRLFLFSSEPLPAPDGKETIAARQEDGLLAIPVTVGDEEFWVHLDTGSPALLSLPAVDAARLPLASAPVEVGRAQLVDATVTIRSAPLDGTLQIGRHRIESPEVQFLDGGSVGNVGIELLQRFALTVDHERGRVRLVAPEGQDGAATVRAAVGEPRRMIVSGGGKRRYGIRFPGIGGDELEVLGVDQGGPAAQGGLQAGDRIIAMNGTPTRDLDSGQRVDALRGSPLELRVRRGTTELELTLSLD